VICRGWREELKGRSDVLEVVVAHAVDAKCMADCTRLQKVTLLSALTGVGWGAFWHCGQLQEITFPEGVAFTDECIFEGCGALSSVTLPSTLTTMNQKCFHTCALVRIVLPPRLEEITRGMFWNNVTLEEVVVPPCLKKVGPLAFVGCTSLKRLRLPMGCAVDPSAFNGAGMGVDGDVFFTAAGAGAVPPGPTYLSVSVFERKKNSNAPGAFLSITPSDGT
jgi:hypothetical protein